nr:related to ECM4 protein (involved in cell wall biogenesis and architecture) [Neurospora crassa]
MASSDTITNWVDPNDKTGEFKRQVSSFRSFISRSDPSSPFPPEKGRYHLYVSYACPWATRALIVRKLKGLEDIISFSSVHWHMGPLGWRFPLAEEGKEGGDAAGDQVVPDPVGGKQYMREVYFGVEPEYNARFTVPVLFDKKEGRIVNNESSEIVRMLGSEFNEIVEDAKARELDLYPEDLRAEIDEVNEWVYHDINNGVYKSGFATTQEAYERNVIKLFEGLDKVEKHLKEVQKKGKGEFWFGDRLTEVDVRLFPTIIRFDPVYVQHFKCNLRDIRSGYPAIHRWMRHLYWNVPAFRETTNFLHIKKHYTCSHPQINPKGITPLGPVPDILPLDEEVEAVKAAKN